MYRAGIASILSQLVREERLSVVDQIALDSPKTRLFVQKIKASAHRHGAGRHRQARRQPVPVVAQSADVLVLETREVDPVSLVRFNNVLLTKAARSRNSRRRWDEHQTAQQAGKFAPERLALVLLAPIVSEKGTIIADKHEQVIFRVRPTRPSPK